MCWNGVMVARDATTVAFHVRKYWEKSSTLLITYPKIYPNFIETRNLRLNRMALRFGNCAKSASSGGGALGRRMRGCASGDRSHFD